MKVKLVALKPMRYRTRMLSAGDPFEAPNRPSARALIAIRKARYGDSDGQHPESDMAPQIPPPLEAPPEPPQGAQAEADAETGARTDALRAEYERLVGAKPDRRWGAARLQREIADRSGNADDRA